jgi:hypothetical protein
LSRKYCTVQIYTKQIATNIVFMNRLLKNIVQIYSTKLFRENILSNIVLKIANNKYLNLV